ncbi:MAG: ribonuclease H [Actinobacteria bacterium]|nr:ribonuclease H [Actinomycetota bacterium]
MPKQKFYVVWKGRKPGIYRTWSDCEAQVKGQQGAKFKAFPSRDEAEAAFKNPEQVSYQSKVKSNEALFDCQTPPILDSISVDAACSGNPGVMEYRGVYTETGAPYFHKTPIQRGTNNLGEFLAIVHALALQKQAGQQLPIYTDSRTAMAWVKNQKVKSLLKREPRSEEVWGLVDRALQWLKENEYQNPLLKWDTKNWGQIRADYDRK